MLFFYAPKFKKFQIKAFEQKSFFLKNSIIWFKKADLINILPIFNKIKRKKLNSHVRNLYFLIHCTRCFI
jgi:hypothetical protein